MILFIPYHENLPVSYKELALSIRKAGTNPNHTLAVISLRSHDDGAFRFSDLLSDYFGRVIKVSIDDRPESATDTSNRFFAAALDAFRKYKPMGYEPPNSPMMYFDPSYIPNNPRWLDDLQADFFRQGAPTIFGRFNKEGGEPAPVGPLILSRKYIEVSTLISFVPRGERWRSYLSWEMYKQGVEAAGIGIVGDSGTGVVIPQSEIARLADARRLAAKKPEKVEEPPEEEEEEPEPIVVEPSKAIVAPKVKSRGSRKLPPPPARKSAKTMNELLADIE